MLAEISVALPAESMWIDTLTPYAVGARYGLVEPGGLSRSRTLESVNLVLRWAKSVVDPGTAH